MSDSQLTSRSARASNVHVNPQNSYTSMAVKVPVGSEILFIGGVRADPVEGAPPTRPLGDTKTQVLSILKKVEAILQGQGYELSHIVMMRVLLAADPEKGEMDFAGLNEAYNEVYGPLETKPARITCQVAGLVRPGMLVEIEAQAAKVPGN